MSKYWSAIVEKLTPYVPGEQPTAKSGKLVKLNTNENPYPPSPEVVEAIQSAAEAGLQKYPDPECKRLKQSIADYYSLAEDQVFVGNSSDEVLAHSFQGLLKQEKPLYFPDITYGFYPVYCELFEIDYVTVPLADDFSLNIDDYPSDNGGIIFANPNAPTGLTLSIQQIKSLLQKCENSVVIIDEAYVDFGAESAIALINEFDNLLVTQTFSKSRALAGLRVGFACGNADLIEALERVKNSFNAYPLDQMALSGACAAINDEAYFLKQRNKVIEIRSQTMTKLTELGFTVVDSQANFIFARPPEKISAQEMFLALRQKDVIVRYFDKPRIKDYLRITIGTDEEMSLFYTALTEILSI